jgi:hypothetical protein
MNGAASPVFVRASRDLWDFDHQHAAPSKSRGRGGFRRMAKSTDQSKNSKMAGNRKSIDKYNYLSALRSLC